jgi:CubicO group peptidase (beta-lactamase class C family)
VRGLPATALGVVIGVAAVGVVPWSSAFAQSDEPAPCASSDPVACLDEALTAAAADDAFGGVVVIGEQGQPVLAEGYGMQPSGEPYTADSTFEIASLGKMITAVAIGQLLDAGSLTLEDRAGDHVASLPPAVADTTIAQLLSHTSGMADNIEEGITGEPGTFRYTNVEFDVLAAIVEAVSGQPFADYLSEHVFGPAGMTDTSLTIANDDGSPIGWGGETSTGLDLIRFIDALLAERLLQPATTDLFLSPKVETDAGSHYGYGFEIFGDPDAVHSFGHWGLDDLFIGWVDVSEADGVALVALCDRGCDVMGGPLIGFAQEVGLPA